ncbi:MAG: hypothetical protein QNJ98_05745 [Planctomycetota bacterium]|nr:hypothetical protein [Planctomycetota bacterium]
MLKLNKNFALGMMVVPLALLGLGVAVASSVSTPNTFVSGTTIVAADVNANFAAHEAAINDNDSRLTTLEGAGAPKETVIIGSPIGPAASQDFFALIDRSASFTFADVAAMLPRAGTLEGFSCKATTALTAGSSVTVSVVVNGVTQGATSLTFTSADGTTLKVSPAAPIVVSAGDLVAFRFTETGGTGSGGKLAPSLFYR